MRPASLMIPLLAFALLGCPGSDGSIGEPCNSHGDCSSELQCLSNVCVARCQRAPECGDGYSCDEAGLCHAATGQSGDRCASEVECAAGLSCQIEGNQTDSTGNLIASCVTENA